MQGGGREGGEHEQSIPTVGRRPGAGRRRAPCGPTAAAAWRPRTSRLGAVFFGLTLPVDAAAATPPYAAGAFSAAAPRRPGDGGRHPPCRRHWSATYGGHAPPDREGRRRRRPPQMCVKQAPASSAYGWGAEATGVNWCLAFLARSSCEKKLVPGWQGGSRLAPKLPTPDGALHAPSLARGSATCTSAPFGLEPPRTLVLPRSATVAVAATRLRPHDPRCFGSRAIHGQPSCRPAQSGPGHRQLLNPGEIAPPGWATVISCPNTHAPPATRAAGARAHHTAAAAQRRRHGRAAPTTVGGAPPRQRAALPAGRRRRCRRRHASRRGRTVAPRVADIRRRDRRRGGRYSGHANPAPATAGRLSRAGGGAGRGTRRRHRQRPRRSPTRRPSTMGVGPSRLPR